MSEEMNKNDNVFIEKTGDIEIVDNKNIDSIENNNDKKWYPGKLIGLMKKSKEDNKAYENNVNRDENANTTAEIEDIRQEAMIVKTVRGIRLKYLERQLTGRIYIYRMSGVIATAITSDVSSDDIGNYLLDKIEKKGSQAFYDDDQMNKADLSSNYKRALSTTDSILNSLERRSLCWLGAEFGSSTMLTRGTTIGVSDPFIGMIAFSFTIELSCTVHTLLASRKRFEAMKELANCICTYDSSSSSSSDSMSTIHKDNTNNSNNKDNNNNNNKDYTDNNKFSSNNINKDNNKPLMLSGWLRRSKSNISKDDIDNTDDRNKNNSNNEDKDNNIIIKDSNFDAINEVTAQVYNNSLHQFSDSDNDQDTNDDEDENRDRLESRDSGSSSDNSHKYNRDSNYSSD